MLRKEISREELNELPLASFEGKITLVTDPDEISSIIRVLRKSEFVGFDTETRPAFVKGQKFPISLTQLATEEHAFLIRNQYTGWPRPLLEFLANPSVLKIGVGIRDDVKSIKAQARINWNPEGFVELNTLVKEFGVVSQGIRKLSGLFLGIRVSKSAQTSNWDKELLNDKQLKYAATDAWCCHQIYHQILTRGFIE